MKGQCENVFMFLPVDSHTPIKIEGHVGTWSVIDAIMYGSNFIALCEHNTYGDETAMQIVKLANVWVVAQGGYGEINSKKLFVSQERIIGETYDGLTEGLQDCGWFMGCSEEEINKLYLTAEEINNMEV